MFSFFTNFWDKLKEMMSEFLELLLTPFMYILDIINSVINYFTGFLDYWISYFNDIYLTFNDSWINPQVPAIPTFFVDSMNFLNSFFPLDTFLNLVMIIILLWCFCLILKLIIRIVTLGQA